VLTLVCAALFALHVVLSAHWTKKHSGMSLATLQVAFVGVAASPMLFVNRPAHLSSFVILSILFLAIVTTALAFYLLMWGQAHLTAAEAAIILAFEPVAAALTSICIYGEPLVVKQHLLGGGLILAAMLLSQWKLPESESAPMPG
jgi:drug/metabolite transporter (DMT)-like permease